MPLMKMTLYTEQQLTNIQTQFLVQQMQSQPQSFLRLGAISNRNFAPIIVQGNKSCKSCGGK